MKSILTLMGFNFAPIQSVDSLSLELAWGWATLVVLALIFLPIFAWLYKFEDKPHEPALGRRLLTLRLLFAVCLLGLLAGPRFTVTGMIPQKNKFAVLIDSSKSMSIREDNLSRIDRVKAAFTRDHLLDRLETQTGVAPSIFSFAGQVSPLSKEDIASFSVFPEGDQTNLSRAITEVSGSLGAGNLLGIIVMTDGAHNRGDNPLDALLSMRVPLYFLGAGKAGQAKDLSVSLDRPPSIGFLNAKIRVRGEVRAFRVATGSVTVEVKKDGKAFETLPVAIASGETRAAFNLQIPCDTEGLFTYTVNVPKLDGELTHENNETSFLLKVVKERLKIVALIDSPNWDFSFLKTAVRSDPNAHVDAFIRVMDNRWLEVDDFVLKGSSPSLNVGQDLEDADVLVLRGIPEATLRPFAELIQKRIESGKMGAWILPSNQPYSALGYVGSPLATIFPVELAGETWRGNACNFVLPSREAPYAFLRLLDDPIENQEFYRTLPKLDGLYTYSRLKTGAEVLLASTMESPKGAVPALFTHRLGRGNVAMLAGGPLWPTGFKLVPTGKGNRPYTALVLNLLKWLANRREDAQVVLDIPAARGFVGQPATFRVWVSDTRRQPIDSALVGGTLSAKEGDPIRLTFAASPEKGCYETTFLPSRRGKYDLAVEAKLQGTLLGEAKGQFLVEPPTAEFDDPEVKVELMSQLASTSGGIFLPVEQAGDLLKDIKPTPGQKRETKVLDFRDNGWVLAFVLLLPLVEWIIRRRKGFS